MATLATFQLVTAPARRHGLRAALTDLYDRLTASTLDSPVLRAVAAQAPAGPPARMRARWRPVTAADGTTRLEATWHPDH
ncbi:hypothetical protein LN042_11750 [Kitasatospora sp. RB6PN24]|uniref:hypothetical protein n=1 Tax=Kitasatospora humi TaxID=2893891 RepID=UPI001E6436D8|nr:hypothetical protein [Kitasatospora humi]MCC9307759.1 hypothetical protein [Kitasatospora humi]